MSTAAKKSIASLSVPELLQHALVIELEAEQSYADMANQMHDCGNHDVGALFTKMAALEGRHAKKLREHVTDFELQEIAPWEYQWADFEPPENVELNEIHYLMTPHHALSLALAAELRAKDFFSQVASVATDEAVKNLAIEFADDEAQHAEWMRDWLASYPPPAHDWAEDPDPPVAAD